MPYSQQYTHIGKCSAFPFADLLQARNMVKSGGLESTRASIMAKQKTAASSQRVSIPARHAKAALVKKGRRIKVINTHGTQVVDCCKLTATAIC